MCRFLRNFCTQCHVTCKRKLCFFLCNLDSFYLFVLSGCPGWSVRAEPERTGEKRHPILVLDLRWRAFGLFPECGGGWALCSCWAAGWGCPLMFLVCWVFVLSWRELNFCQMHFLHLLKRLCGFCPLFCWYMVDYINCFSYIEPPLHSWDKSHGVSSVVCIFLEICPYYLGHTYSS